MSSLSFTSHFFAPPHLRPRSDVSPKPRSPRIHGLFTLDWSSLNVSGPWHAAVLIGKPRSELTAVPPSVRALLSIPRVPTAAMLAAPVYVAIATYAQARTDVASGRAVGWAIVIAKNTGETKARIGSTAGTDLAPLITAELEFELRTVQGPVWISLPKKRRGLAATLERAGFPVTVGLGAGSRAEPELREQIARQSRRLQVDATQAGVVGAARTRNMPGSPDPAATVHWFPSERRVAKHKDLEILHIATDASLEHVAYSRVFAACAVSGQGDGQEANHAGEQHFEEALHTPFLTAWRQVNSETWVTLSHVRGHAGNSLNEAADSIARAARRATTIPLPEGSRAFDQHLSDTLRAILSQS